MEREIIGSRSALEWVKEGIGALRKEFELGRFKARFRDFKIIETTRSDRVVTFVGQEELGVEAIGFIAGFVDGKIKMLSVFVDLKDRFVWIKKEGNREKLNEINKT